MSVCGTGKGGGGGWGVLLWGILVRPVKVWSTADKTTNQAQVAID